MIKGVKDFLRLIDYNDSLYDGIDDNTEVVWYPGCGGDISPCTLLEENGFEEEIKKKIGEKIEIDSNIKRIYIFTDPDRYHMCKDAYYGKKKIYDLTLSSSFKDTVSIENLDIENITLKSGVRAHIDGKYITYDIDNKKVRIFYLKIPMQDFLRDYIRIYNIKIKWLFYINMENKGGKLFNLFEENNVDFPEWLCANRIGKFGIDHYYKVLQPVDYYKVDNDEVMFLQRKENDSITAKF